MAKAITIEASPNGFTFVRITFSGFAAENDVAKDGVWVAGMSDIVIKTDGVTSAIKVSGETVFLATETDSDIEVNGTPFHDLTVPSVIYFAL